MLRSDIYNYNVQLDYFQLLITGLSQCRLLRYYKITGAVCSWSYVTIALLIMLVCLVGSLLWCWTLLLIGLLQYTRALMCEWMIYETPRFHLGCDCCCEWSLHVLAPLTAWMLAGRRRLEDGVQFCYKLTLWLLPVTVRAQLARNVVINWFRHLITAFKQKAFKRLRFSFFCISVFRF